MSPKEVRKSRKLVIGRGLLSHLILQMSFLRDELGLGEVEKLLSHVRKLKKVVLPLVQ